MSKYMHEDTQYWMHRINHSQRLSYSEGITLQNDLSSYFTQNADYRSASILSNILPTLISERLIKSDLLISLLTKPNIYGYTLIPHKENLLSSFYPGDLNADLKSLFLDETFVNNLYDSGLGWVHRHLSRSNFLPTTQKTGNDLSEELQFFYVGQLPYIVTSITSGIPYENQTHKYYDYQPNPSIPTLIYNQTGIIASDQMYSLRRAITSHEGNALSLGDIPIGYSIHLPKNTPTGILVTAYGGCGEPYQPGNLQPHETALLEKDLVIVKVNCLDSIKQVDEQFEMPQDLHEIVHASLNRAYEALKEPTSLHPSLAPLEGLNICLSGHSFGGNVTARHAQKYPNTFTSYISLDGALSYQALCDTDLGRFQDRTHSTKALEASQWLDPYKYVHDTKDPMLIVHNFNDSNANIKGSLEYYKKAISCNKENLVRFLAQSNGSSSMFPPNKGHFVTKELAEFNTLIKTIADFITTGEHTISLNTSNFQAAYAEAYSLKNDSVTPWQDKFVAEAFRLYNKMESSGVGSILQSWDNLYAPLAHKCGFMSLISKNSDWLNEVIQTLLMNYGHDIYSGDMIDKAILASKDCILENLRAHGLEKQFYIRMDQTTGSKFSLLHKQYLDYLSDQTADMETRIYLLDKLFTANPELLQHYVDFNSNHITPQKNYLITVIQEIENLQLLMMSELVGYDKPDLTQMDLPITGETIPTAHDIT